MTSFRERLLAKAIINWETGCWEWTAGRSHNGYGHINRPGTPRKKLMAHRVSYELVYGPIPEGLQIDHLCRVRHCINPAHLEVVTAHENVLRAAAMAVKASTHCRHGHEYTPENTYNSPGGDRRECRICKRARARKRWAAPA